MSTFNLVTTPSASANVNGLGAGSTADPFMPTQIPVGLLASVDGVDGITTVNKFGEAIDCDSGSPTDVWDGANGSTAGKVWTAPKAARVHTVTSTNASDTVAGTGARTVKIYGLQDWDSAETSEVIDLDGTDDVNTANSYVIIHRMKVVTWGVGGVNAGNIIATAAVDTTVTAAILATQNQTQMCIYGVPSTHKLRVHNFSASIVKGSGQSQRADGEVLMMTDPATNVVDGVAWTNKENFLLVEDITPWSHDYGVTPKKFDGPCIVKLQVTANAADVKAVGSFDAYLVKA